MNSPARPPVYWADHAPIALVALVAVIGLGFVFVQPSGNTYAGLAFGGNNTTPICGNAITEIGEQCDFGTNNSACPGLCSPTCTWNNCTSSAVCGNLIVEYPMEQCDGYNLDGATCTGLGYSGGALSCTPYCSFDTQNCTNTSDSILPTAIILSPKNGAPVSGTITATASATDNIGVQYVYFYFNNVAVGTDFTAPYTATIYTASFPNGMATLSATAVDTTGNAQASFVTVYVQNGVNDTFPPNITNVTAQTYWGQGMMGGLVPYITITWYTNELADSSALLDTVSPPVTGAAQDLTQTQQHSITYGSGSGVITPNTRYYYRVSSRDAAGNTASSAVYSIQSVGDTTPPVISGGSPTGTVATTKSVTLRVTTNEAASCRHGEATTAFSSMTKFTTSGGTAHSTVLTVAPGKSYVRYVKCQDSVGNINAAGYPVSFSVAPDTTAPSVSINNPKNNMNVTGTVTLSATASDNIGVVGVQFFVDNVALGAEDKSSPYAVTWNSKLAGRGYHVLTARARDSAGNSKLSAPITVYVP